MGEAERDALVAETGAPLTRYTLSAPISGTVIERHAVLGEVIEEGAQPPAFIIADTSTLWSMRPYMALTSTASRRVVLCV